MLAAGSGGCGVGRVILNSRHRQRLRTAGGLRQRIQAAVETPRSTKGSSTKGSSTRGKKIASTAER